MAAIAYPADLNGIVEAGIAAGVDNFTDSAYALTVRMRAASGAPLKPTVAQLATMAFVRAYNELPDKAARVTFLAVDRNVTGGSGATVKQILDNLDHAIGDMADPIDKVGAVTIDATIKTYEDWVKKDADTRDYLEVDLDATLAEAPMPGTSAVARKLWQGLIAYVVSNGWIIARQVASNGMLRYAGPEIASGTRRSNADINTIGFHPAQECANLVVALKLTWWQTNHHVGQDSEKLAGFIGKIATLQGLISEADTVQNREVRNVLWAIGKMVSTRGVLQATGVTGILYEDRSLTGKDEGNDYARTGTISIGASADVALRASSSPAGASDVTTYYAIFKRAMSSIYGICVPPMTTIRLDRDTGNLAGESIEAVEALKSNAARYHMGSTFLTGSPRTVLNAFTEEERANLSAFIYATAENGTLAQASVILKKTEIIGNVTYSTIQRIKSDMGEAAGSKMAMMLITRLTGGGEVGGLSKQFGKISDEDVKAAKLAIEGGEAKDDEGADSGDESGVTTRSGKGASGKRKLSKGSKGKPAKKSG